MAEDEAVVYDFVTELTTTHKVSDETYARAKKVFNDQQIVDLTAVAGNYVMVAMLLAMAEETVPPARSRRSRTARSKARADPAPVCRTLRPLRPWPSTPVCRTPPSSCR